MSWYTGFTKIKEEVKTGEKVLAKLQNLGLDIGTPVRYNGNLHKIKQLWINTFGDIHIRVELDHPNLEDVMIELNEIEYGKAIEVLFGISK